MVDRLLCRRAGLVLVAAAATFTTLIAAAVSVVACTSLATLQASGSAIPLGQPVTVNGRHFATDPALSPIEVRDSTTNVVLWSGRPDENGDFTATLVTAGFAPGYHVIVASEVDAHGQAVSGTPARVVVNVVSDAQRTQGAAWGRTTAAAAHTAGASSAPVALLMTAAAGVALFALLGVMVWAVARRRRTRALGRLQALDMWEHSLALGDDVFAGHGGDHNRET